MSKTLEEMRMELFELNGVMITDDEVVETYMNNEISSEEAVKEFLELKNKQVGGSHYSEMTIEPIVYITKNNIPYREGNVIKYISRYKNKNGLEDLKKAQHYVQMLIDDYEKVQ